MASCLICSACRFYCALSMVGCAFDFTSDGITSYLLRKNFVANALIVTGLYRYSRRTHRDYFLGFWGRYLHDHDIGNEFYALSIFTFWILYCGRAIPIYGFKRTTGQYEFVYRCNNRPVFVYYFYFFLSN